MGYDDIMLAQMAMPGLTTVRQPIAEMATGAFAKLREQTEAETATAGHSVLHRPELVVRGSTGPAPAPRS